MPELNLFIYLSEQNFNGRLELKTYNHEKDIQKQWLFSDE